MKKIEMIRFAITAGLLLSMACSNDFADMEPLATGDGEGDDVAAIGEGGNVVARRAGAFVSTVGVNLHLGYPRTGYYDRFPELKNLLLESRIRNLRDSVPVGKPEVVNRMKDLGSNGFRFNLLLFNHDGSRNIEEYVAQKLAVVKEHLLGHVVSLEGHNEPDGSWPDRANWPAGSTRWMRAIWEQTNADPSLTVVPILGNALAHPYRQESKDALGNLTGIVDWANVHAYPGARPPEAQIAWVIAQAKEVQYPGLPTAVTETGYHSALETASGKHVPASERARTIYLPRILAENFRTGILHTYIYQFYDHIAHDEANPETEFGLVDFNMVPKRSFHSLKNMLSLLEDPDGDDFTPGELSYEIQDGPEDLRQLLLQKRNGTFYLLLWRTVSVWDRDARQDVFPAYVPYTLKLPRPMGVSRYRPSQGAEAQARHPSLTTIHGALDGNLLILELSEP